MRYLAQIEGRKPAESFVAFLVTKSIPTHIEGTSDNPELWEVWVKEEDDLEAARKELTTFLQNPGDSRYEAALPEARRIIKEKQESMRAASQNVKKIVPRNPSPMGNLGSGRLPPLTLTLFLLCVIISLLSNFGIQAQKGSLAYRIFSQLQFVNDEDYQKSGFDPAVNLKQGQIWRTITPIFLHGSPLHLALNMIMLVMLGRLAESIEGTPRYALLILLLTLIPNLLAGLMPPQFGGSPNFVGISGVTYGLASYLWMVSQQRPELGFRIPGSFMVILMVIMALEFAGVITGHSYWSHLGGFITGLAIGLATKN